MHFSVAVFTEQDGATIDELLAPYDEGLIVPHYISKEEIIAKVRADIARTRKWYDEYLKDPVKYEEAHNNKAHIEYLTTQFPKKLEWSDEECYADGLKYYNEEQIKPDGSVYEDFNPNAQWDWYEIGGRFEDILPLKSGGFATTAHAKDVSADYYVNSEGYESSLKFWKTYIEGNPDEGEAVAYELSDAQKGYYIGRFKTAENFAKYSSSLGLQALLMPYGEWIDEGSATWDGDNTDECAVEAWERICAETLEQAARNGWDVTIVDCHI